MKKIILLILVLTFSQKITYAFDLIAVPKDISKLNILGITFDSKIADIKKLLSTNPNLTGETIPLHYTSSSLARISVTYYIEPKTDSEVPLSDLIMVFLFNNQVAMIFIGTNYFSNGAHAKPLEILDNISDPSTFGGLGDLLLQELSAAYGDYQIEDTPIIANVDGGRLEWNKGKYVINYLVGQQGVVFVNSDIEEEAYAKSDKLEKLEDASTVKINANRVAFRQSASLSSKVLARLQKNETLDNLGLKRSESGKGVFGTVVIGPWRAFWYKVRRSNGQEGWVYGWFLDPVE